MSGAVALSRLLTLPRQRRHLATARLHDGMRHRKGEGLTAAVHSHEAPGEIIALGRANSLNATNHLLTQYRNAREELNAGLDLLKRAIDLRELLQSGLDLDDMRDEVDAFNRACNLHKARRRLRS